MNLIKIMYVLMFYLMAINSFAGSTSFETANKLYMTQHYDEAVKAYEEILKSGTASAELYYNLGNSYYKSGDYTKAILNYERAKKIRASDEDVLFNLAVVNQKTVDKIEEAPKVFYERWWAEYLASSNAGTRSVIGIMLIWFAAIAGTIYIFTKSYPIKKLSFFGSFLLLFTGLFFLLVAKNQNSYSQNHREAIILPDNCYVKSSPDEKSTNLFMLHSGTKIELKDELQGWKKIKIPNGNEGWLRDESVEVI